MQQRVSQQRTLRLSRTHRFQCGDQASDLLHRRIHRRIHRRRRWPSDRQQRLALLSGHRDRAGLGRSCRGVTLGWQRGSVRSGLARGTPARAGEGWGDEAGGKGSQFSSRSLSVLDEAGGLSSENHADGCIFSGLASGWGSVWRVRVRGAKGVGGVGMSRVRDGGAQPSL